MLCIVFAFLLFALNAYGFALASVIFAAVNTDMHIQKDFSPLSVILTLILRIVSICHILLLDIRGFDRDTDWI